MKVSIPQLTTMSSNIPDYLLGPPPPGVTPNYAHPRSWAWETYFTVSICLSFLIPFVLMRLYSRKVVTRSMGIDDCKVFRELENCC